MLFGMVLIDLWMLMVVGVIVMMVLVVEFWICVVYIILLYDEV